MKVKSFLLTAALLSSSAVSAVSAVETQLAEVKIETSYRDQIVTQAEQFVEKTVNFLATPFISDKDIECLARNIFYESGGEPLEGKIAVGMVTMNRTQDQRYPSTICEVVKQKTVLTVPKTVKETKTIKTGWLTEPKQVVETKTTYVQKVVYQFSWVGMRNIRIKEDDPRWVESKRVAEGLARGEYWEYQEKYGEAMNFHAVYVRPGWNLKKIGRVGNHIFYKGTKPGQ